MLWKLLKYDFRAMVKSFAILWPASLVVALVNRFTIPFDQPLDNELLAVVTMVAFFSVLFAMCVAVLIFIVQRFYKGLLGDEGYLMHTLPVRTWQLVASKLICALVTSVVSIAVAILAIIILFPIKWETVFNLATFRALWAALTRRPDIPLFITEYSVLFLCGILLCITTIYLAIAVGHLFQRHRVVMSVAAFIALDILGSVYIDVLDGLNLFNAIAAQNEHMIAWLVSGLLLIPSGIFFAGACGILHSRLNLE
ncbi:hypothetical protein [Flavonifractor sp. An100]|uniref:hypothetical protein n=1 Tax=Flavonifractor sp. An100 TaxID=1965538 RepID=UPI000B39FF31|nr:hypothetical protein [Flavonifractor sp. An100]OUQ79487.1 hypothetical protein B5E43_05950 [Flavonifractor sp. An100]